MTHPNSSDTVHPPSFLKKLNDVCTSAWFAYLTLILFQLKIIWGIWKYRDLTAGDTSAYFDSAYLWFEHFQVNLVWSPIYTAFYGSFLHFSRDAYFATTMHRVVIIFTLCVLVLWLMRKLLPAPVAWLMAAWWCVLPINFNSMYEVHMFAVIPLLAAWLVILSQPSSWGRGWAIAIFCSTAILVRNEISVAAAVLSVSCAVWEFREARNRKNAGEHGWNFRKLALAYGVPLMLALMICTFFYSRSIIKYPLLMAVGKPKHYVNMGQVYAFGYQQRHPEWEKSPWLDWEPLVQRDFGIAHPSLVEMFKRNPRAILENMWWNLKLTPSGMQLLLFNSISGNITPDYIPVKFHAREALPLSVLACLIWGVGLTLLYRERTYWWEHWLKQRAPGWLAMLSVLCVAPLIIVTQRPRPSYLFSVSIFLMALTGMCLFVIFHRWQWARRLSLLVPVAMVLLPVFTPSYFVRYNRDENRYLLEFYCRLSPYRGIIMQSDAKFLSTGYSIDGVEYIIHQYPAPRPLMVDYSVLQKMPADMPVGKFLQQNGITFFYMHESLRTQFDSNPIWRQFLSNPAAEGWTQAAPAASENAHWMFLQKAAGNSH